MNRVKKSLLSAAGIVVLGSWALASSFPFADNFEGFTNDQPVNGVNGWVANEFVVATNMGLGVAPSGAKAAVVGLDSSLSNTYGTVTATNVWADFYVLPRFYTSAAGEEGPPVMTNASAQFWVDSNGYWRIVGGLAGPPGVTTNILTLNALGGAVAPLASGTWAHVSAFLDYKAKKYAFMVNDVPLAVNQNFITNANTYLTLFWLYNGAGNTAMLDAFQLTNRVPNTLSADNDGDGMIDAWEIMYAGDLTTFSAANAGADPDGDGLSNLLESQARSNPYLNTDPGATPYPVGLPFYEPFESPRTVGALYGQMGWDGQPSANVQIQTSTKFQGAQALQMSYGYASHDFVTAATSVWTHLVIKPIQVSATVAEITNLVPTNVTVVFYVDTNGWVHAYSNNVVVKLTNYLDGAGAPQGAYTPIAASDWVRFVAHSDYVGGKWSLYMMDLGSGNTSAFARLIGKDLQFKPGPANLSYEHFMVTNFPGGTSFVDNIEITMGMSPWVDTDNDLVPDLAEIEIGSDPLDPSEDTNGNGIPDREDYAFGAANAKIVNLDRLTASSPHMRLSFIVGSNRTYTVLASATYTGSKTPVGSFYTGLQGENNTFVHSNALPTFGSKGFYSLASVSPEGLSGATSTVPVYAWYRQGRGPVPSWHWVGVPVDYGASNALDKALGQHLAQGLVGNNNYSLADQISIMRSDGTWSNFYLNGSGVWCPVGSVNPATNEIPVGQGILIRRRATGVPADTNAVFAGACRTNASYTIPINVGWNFISWPYDQGTYNWGFVGNGSSIVTNSDEIWFNRPSDPTHNHLRLWADGKWRFVPNTGEIGTDVIQLQPGEGFYYRNRGAAATTWQPQKP